MTSTNYEGTSYAIPTTVVQHIVSELISKGEITSRAKLGITYNMIDSITAEISEYKQIGIRISQIDGSSALYGKAESGDTITHINGVKITKAEIMLDVIDKCRAGDLITITIVKPDGTSKNIEVKLGAIVSQSSYKTVDDTDNSSSSSGGSFDFPFGE
jgi:S1-C subfamily serine protease